MLVPSALNPLSTMTCSLQQSGRPAHTRSTTYECPHGPEDKRKWMLEKLLLPSGPDERNRRPKTVKVGCQVRFEVKLLDDVYTKKYGMEICGVYYRKIEHVEHEDAALTQVTKLALPNVAREYNLLEAFVSACKTSRHCSYGAHLAVQTWKPKWGGCVFSGADTQFGSLSLTCLSFNYCVFAACVRRHQGVGGRASPAWHPTTTDSSAESAAVRQTLPG